MVGVTKSGGRNQEMDFYLNMLYTCMTFLNNKLFLKKISKGYLSMQILSKDVF